MAVPCLNIPAVPCLLGLCYRALAGDADATGAGLSLRRIEQLQSRSTQLLQEVSTLKMDVQILETRALDCAHEAHQTELDLQLHDQQHAPPPPRRGLFKQRLTAGQRAAREQQSQLAGIAAAAGATAAGLKSKSQEARRRLEALQCDQAGVHAQRSELAVALHEQLAARILGLVAAGDLATAEHELAGARTQVRGDLMVAALLVLVELFVDGPAAALATLGELKPLFRQHPDPLPRVLGALIGLAHQETLSRRDAGSFPPEAFSTAPFNRLYQLVRVLAGWSFDENALSADPFAATLWVLREHMAVRLPAADWTPMPPAELAAWAATTEPVVQAIAANTLLLRDSPQHIPTAAGLDFTRFAAPVRKRDRWPELWPLPATPPAWPAALVPVWRSALACHVLATARETAPAALYETWLAESYNWPKSDLYWWTLSQLKHDLLLQHNLSGTPSQLFTVQL